MGFNSGFKELNTPTSFRLKGHSIAALLYFFTRVIKIVSRYKYLQLQNIYM